MVGSTERILGLCVFFAISVSGCTDRRGNEARDALHELLSQRIEQVVSERAMRPIEFGGGEFPAAFIQPDFLEVSPDATGHPWYRVTTGSELQAAVDRARASSFVSEFVIDIEEPGECWASDAVQYCAFSFQFRLRSTGAMREHWPYEHVSNRQYRITVKYDPRAGAWEVETLENLSELLSDIASRIDFSISEQVSNTNTLMNESKQLAINAAFDQIERRLQARFTVRGSDFVSDEYEDHSEVLDYRIIEINQHSIEVIPHLWWAPDNRISTLLNICGEGVPAAYQNLGTGWRTATVADVLAILDVVSRQGLSSDIFLSLADTPDRRIWGNTFDESRIDWFILLDSFNTQRCSRSNMCSAYRPMEQVIDNRRGLLRSLYAATLASSGGSLELRSWVVLSADTRTPHSREQIGSVDVQSAVGLNRFRERRGYPVARARVLCVRDI